MANDLILLFWTALFLTIIYTDFRKRIVYNFQILIEFAICILGSFFIGYELNFCAFFSAFIVGILVWKVGIMGAGDVKLLIALIISIPTDKILMFLTIMSFVGFFIAIGVLILRSKRGVPYAPAIAFSHLFIFYDLFY